MHMQYKDNAPKVQAEAPSLPNPADKLKGGFNLELPKPPSIPTLGGGDKAEKKGSDTVGVLFSSVARCVHTA